MIRAFVAIDLPDGVKASLASLQSGIPGARWADAAGLHLTLRFIGDVPETDLEDVDEALAGISAPPFSLLVQGTGQFGQGDRTRALWAGVAPSEPLSWLQQKVESAVVRAGQPPEQRRFQPHVTLARLSSGARGSTDRIQRFIEGHGLLRIGPFPVDRFTLFESRLGHGGAVYSVLRHYELET